MGRDDTVVGSMANDDEDENEDDEVGDEDEEAWDVHEDVHRCLDAGRGRAVLASAINAPPTTDDAFHCRRRHHRYYCCSRYHYHFHLHSPCYYYSC